MAFFPKPWPSFLRRYRPGDSQRIEPPSLEHVDRILAFFEWVERAHRYEVHGLEFVPPTGPALLVSPHAFAAIDMFLLAKRIFERDGRVARGLTDHMVFRIPIVRDLFATLGVVDGTPANARALFASGQLAACMPGGGLEASRPSSLRRQLRWADHRGYARIAVNEGVPIIPTACPRADDLYLVLVDGWRLGSVVQRVLGTSRVVPIPVFLGLGVLPFPVKLVQHVAEPQWPLPHGTPEERALELDTRVRGILQDLLER